MTKKKYAPYVTKDGLDVQKLSLPHRIQLLMTGGIDKIDHKTGNKRNVWKEGFVDPVLYLGRKSLQIAGPVLKQIHEGHTKAAELQIQQHNLQKQELTNWWDSNTYDNKLSSELGRSVTKKEAKAIKEENRKNKAKQDLVIMKDIRNIQETIPVTTSNQTKIVNQQKEALNNGK